MVVTLTANQFEGHINFFEIGKADFDIQRAGSTTIWKGVNNVFIATGQSNMSNGFSTLTAGTPLGKEAFLTEAANYTGMTDPILADGATGGASLLKETVDPATNYFFDDATNEIDGDAGIALLEAIQSVGSDAKAIFWDQGEGEVGAINSGTVTLSQVKTGLVTFFNLIRNIVGTNIPVIITPLGRRTAAYSAQDAWQSYREMQRELADENDWIYLAPEKFDLEMDDETGATDEVHLADASYETAFERMARTGSNALGNSVTAYDGPTITGAVRSGTTVTVTLSHSDGADFTPSTGIEGFVFHDDGSPITISSAVRTNSTTITLTLASAPTGTEILYYGYGTMLGINRANLVKDNSTNTLPLRSATVNL